MFAVIEFGGEDVNQTAVVRKEWLTPAKKEVFWPPFKMSSQFNKALVDGTTPDENVWTLHPVRRCLYKCDDLLKAREKERLAERESDLQTDHDEVDGIKRKKRKIVKKKLSCSSDSSADEDSLPSGKRNLFSYPTAPSPENCSSQLLSHPTTPTTELVSTPSNSIEKTVADSGFSVVAKRLSKLEGEILSIKNYLEEVLQRLERYAQSDKDEETTSDSIPPLPCVTKEDVEKLEEWLSSVRANEETLIKFLSRVGGRKMEHCVRKVLERIFTNDLAKSYNWTGKNHKIALKGLKVIDVIFGVIRSNRSTSSSTDDDAEKVIRNWFRFANDREGGREKRRNDTAQTTTI